MLVLGTMPPVRRLMGIMEQLKIWRYLLQKLPITRPIKLVQRHHLHSSEKRFPIFGLNQELGDAQRGVLVAVKNAGRQLTR